MAENTAIRGDVGLWSACGGPDVPLEVVVTYQDRHGEKHELKDCLSVHVVQQGLIPGITAGVATPVEIRIGELYQPGARKEVGDRVDIRRGAERRVSLESGPAGSRVTVRRNGQAVRRCPNCNLPIEDQEHRYCPDCGTPLKGTRG